MRRVLVALLVIVATVYVAALGIVFFRQRAMMYFPDPTERAPAVRGVDFQVVRLTTSDKESLVAWWSPPKPGKPTILFFDGNGGSLTMQEGRWRRISAVGVGIFAPAYRGYSGSTGHPTEPGLHEDARTAYAWLVKHVPAKDIVIQGHSLGSGVATRLASERPARALVLESPYTSTVDVAAQLYPYFPVRLMMRDQFRSDLWIRKVHCPVLIVHGDRDSVIPFRQGRRLYEKANQPKAFVRMRGGDHSDLVINGLYDHVWRFLGWTPPPPLRSPEGDE